MGTWGSAHRSRRVGIVGAVSLGLLAACSSTTSSEGVVATTAAPATTAAATPTEPPATTAGEAPPATQASGDSATTAAEVAPTEPAPATGGSISVGLDAEPPTLDPAANSLSLANGSIYDAIYDQLTFTTPGSELQFQLAESITEADDRLSWVIKVREGVTFHDGTPFDAEAVKFNLERQKASLYNSSNLLPVSAIEVIDPLNVRLVLSEPWTALPNALGGIVGYMVSPTAAADAEAFKRKPVGTGPYMLQEWVPGDKAVLVPFDGHWGEPAKLDEITFKFIQVEAARVAAFEAGEIDAFTTIVERTAEDARADGAQIINPPPTGYGFSYVNLTRPPFDDVRVREALTWAVDADALAEAYQGQGYADRSTSAFHRSSPWWVAPEEQGSFDPERAKALLADYGQPVKFQFKLLAGSQEIEDALRATIEYWNEVGMDAELVIIPDLGTYIAELVTGNFDLLGFIGGSAGDPDSVTYNLYHTGGSLNYSKYSSPVVDAALELGRRSQDEAERKAAYATVQQEVRKDLPTLITSHGSLFIVARPELSLEPDYFFPARNTSF